MTTYYGNELYHYGILGQKWGIRRYQNPDGTYTNEGKERKKQDYISVGKKQIKKSTVAKAAVGAVAVTAAALYVSKHPEVIANVIAKAKDISVKDLSSKAVAKGKKALEEGWEQAKKGATEGIKLAPYQVAKVAAQGAAIMVAKEVLDQAIGKENNADLTKAYNAYNNKKAGKIGSVPSIRKKI